MHHQKCKKQRIKGEKKRKKKTSATDPRTGRKPTREPAGEKTRNDTSGMRAPQIFPNRATPVEENFRPATSNCQIHKAEKGSKCMFNFYLPLTDSNHGNRGTWVRRENKKAGRYVCD